MIRIDQVWLSTEYFDMRCGMDTTLSRVVKVFGAAHPHHAYLFTNSRGNRMKVLVHDGFGIWLASRRLNAGKFNWGVHHNGDSVSLTHEQLNALVLGLPWQKLGSNAVIKHV
jgi:transposase